MAIYLYGLIRSGVTLPMLPEGITPDTPIQITSEEGVAAVTHSVPEGEFNNETLAARFQDMIWLGWAVRAHEAIVETVMQTAPILPMRFCTVYSDEEGVKQMLRQNVVRFIKALDFLNDKAEWGLKIFCNREMVRQNVLKEDATIREMMSEMEGKPAGMTYLLRKRLEQVCLSRIEQEIERLVETVATQIETSVIERFPHETIRVTDEDKQIILNVSYLVANDRTGDLAKCVQEINDQYGNESLRCILSGPWPPYGFAGRLTESVTIASGGISING